jgi:predicted RNase H-like nuclease
MDGIANPVQHKTIPVFVNPCSRFVKRYGAGCKPAPAENPVQHKTIPVFVNPCSRFVKRYGAGCKPAPAEKR